VTVLHISLRFPGVVLRPIAKPLHKVLPNTLAFLARKTILVIKDPVNLELFFTLN